jgi:uncharacterized membrane protein YiaA
MAEIDRKKQQIISYLTLRTLIGFIGITLPILLVVACCIYGGCIGIQDSISSYYHTGVRDLFVGVLFVLGFFLLSYKGYEALDNIVASFGSVFALGVALFPSHNPSPVIRTLHFVSAGLLFAVFIYFSLCLFTKGAKKNDRTKRKNQRNTVYIVCGVLMTVFIICIALSMIFLTDAQLSSYNPVFWFETLALWAFGVSWLTKGQVFWRDAKRDDRDE